MNKRFDEMTKAELSQSLTESIRRKDELSRQIKTAIFISEVDALMPEYEELKERIGMLESIIAKKVDEPIKVEVKTTEPMKPVKSRIKELSTSVDE